MARPHQFLQVVQLLAVEQVVDVADERMLAQVLAAADRRAVRQVALAGVEAQHIVGEPGDDVRAALRAVEGDDDVRLAARQVDHSRHRQQIDLQMPVAGGQFGQLPGQQDAAVALGGADAHQPGQLVATTAGLHLDAGEGAFHRLDLRQQAPAALAQAVAAGGTHEQRAAAALFQRLDAPRHRGVIDPQAACRGGQGAGARQFEEVTQIVPVHGRLPECWSGPSRRLPVPGRPPGMLGRRGSGVR